MTDIVARLATFSTSAISDALDRLSIHGQAGDIRPLAPGMRLAGRAFTGLYQPVDVFGGTVGDYVDDVPPGAVVVLDNAGRLDATVWGDILTMVAHRRGLAGTVVNGVCRDGDRATELGYPIFSRARWMRTGKGRVSLVSVDVPVTLGHVRVHPADIVIGDGDGVVVVPAGHEDRVAAAAQEITDAEDEIRRDVENGFRLDEARARRGYFHLQAPPT